MQISDWLQVAIVAISIMMAFGSMMAAVIAFFLKRTIDKLDHVISNQTEIEKIQVVQSQKVADQAENIADVTEKVGYLTEKFSAIMSLPDRITAVERDVQELRKDKKVHDQKIQALRFRDHELGNGLTQMVGIGRLNKLQYVDDFDFKLPQWSFEE